jgi:predicted nucleic acid-binding protein
MTVLFDSSVWISYFHISDVHHEKAKRIVDDAIVRHDTILVPGIVYCEVLNNIWKLTEDEEKLARCLTVLKKSAPFIQLIVGDKNFWFSVIDDIIPLVKLKSSDLIIVALALYYNVSKIETFDKPMKKQVEKLLSV